MKGKLVGCDWELNTLTLQLDDLDEFSVSARCMEILEVADIELKDAQIKLLKEALEFYADKENYVERGGDRTEIMSKDYDEVAQFTGFIYLAGKRAREALKKLEEMEGSCQLTEEA